MPYADVSPTARTPRAGTRAIARGIAGIAAVVSAGLVLSGCATIAPEDDRPVVVTTFTVLADIAQNVAGDHLRVESITKVGAEIHGYEPTPGDVRVTASSTSPTPS